MTWGCDARIVGVCNGRSEHQHHRKRRSQGGDETIGVCFACHEFIHHNPRWARSWGLLVPSWEDPSLIPAIGFADPNSTGPIGGEDGQS